MAVSSKKTAKRKGTPASWKKGQSGNPRGRPRRVVEQEYVDAVMGACPLKDWKRIVRQAVKDAQAGEHKAREFLARYLAPVPDRLEVSGVGGAPIESEITHKEDLDTLSDTELEARFRAKLAERGLAPLASADEAA